ncbi:MAG: DUF805 domain-containing protein [Spirochaetes bacterium]|nr:DUF805 domain-containing protein [Spirochaetota bacterium]
MKWFFEAFMKYAVFSGRARRKEYWMFYLFNMIASIVAVILDSTLGLSGSGGYGALSGLYNLAIIIPTVAVSVRRMHDTGHSGWYMLIPLYNLILACTESDQGSNKYGPDPKRESAASAPEASGGGTP